MRSSYSSMEYEAHSQMNQGWNSLDTDHMYQRNNYPQHPQYPPTSVILRPDQYEETEAPSIAWKGLNLAGKALLSLSPSVGNFTHLTSLYLLNNKLTSIPGSVFKKLTNLTLLDISNNQLVELPSQIENLTNLKHLLLSNNKLTTLPIGIGRLWRLEVLSCDGNQITFPTSDIIQGGAQRVVKTLREQLTPVDPLPPRKWKSANIEFPPGANRVKVFSYNILAETYATEEQHSYAPSHVLKWDNRKVHVLERMVSSDADILCLQEVEGGQFRKYFLPKMKELGYEGVHKYKTRAKTMSDPSSVDGCAIFFRTSKFRMEDRVDIEYQSLAIHNNIPTGPGLDRTIRRDNVALVVILQMFTKPPTGNKGRNSKGNYRRVLVCNTHIHWDPVEADVKLIQSQFMLEEIQKVCRQRNDPNMPLIIAGDFNSEPNSAVFSLLDTGNVAADHKEWNGTNYGKYTKEGASHQLKLRHCFDGICSPEFSNYNGDFMGILDYIWYSSDTIRVLSSSVPPTKKEIITQMSPLPNTNFPSDHIYILTEIELLPYNNNNNKKKSNYK